METLSSQSPVFLEPGEIAVRIREGKLTVGVVGLGWMGLPTACLYAEAGASVIGADRNPRIVEQINRGDSSIDEPGVAQILRKTVKAGRLTATTKTTEAAGASDVIFVVVNTMIDKQKRPDYSAVEDACMNVGKAMRKGCLVVVESTCGPGVTEGIVKPTLEKYSGLIAGEGFGLAYSPIRAMGGRALEDMQSYARVVGGIDKRSLEAACAALSVIVKGELVRVHDIKTAELSKLFETVYRDVNIALAGEFAQLCEQFGVDYVESARAANTQPYSHLHTASVGVGGHCVPIYPYLLMSEAKALDVKLRLPLEARKINDLMPRHAAKLISDGLRAAGRSIKRARVLVLGITYRPNIKEIRYSASLELIEILKRRGARVTAYDPFYTMGEMKALGLNPEPTLKKALDRVDCAVLTVAHDEFKTLNPIELATWLLKPGVVVDCTGLLNSSQIEKSGAIYRGTGRGVWTR